MAKGTDSRALIPPKFTIDLSLAPRMRYLHLIETFRKHFKSLPTLFDEIVVDLCPGISAGKIKSLARLFLRRVYNDEETEELRGISEATGLDMYLLVAFNVLLDLLMGCTSGGVRVEDESGHTRMLHYRTLDWGMDALRDIVVHLDYVQKPRGRIVASAITYFGFVGVLTGVRKDLSISLNFRPSHDSSTFLRNFRFYLHHVLVLLGFRPSISSILRQCLFPPSKGTTKYPQNLTTVERDIPSMACTAAYLTFSDGRRTIVMEKDNRKALVRSSEAFIVAVNHDVGYESTTSGKDRLLKEASNALHVAGMEGLINESLSRMQCLTNLWQNAITKRRSSRARGKVSKGIACATADELDKWMDTYDITNEETHYATVMDPKAGQILWVKRYPKVA